MAQQKIKPKDKQLSTKPVEKKYLVNPKYKNTFWTVVFLIVMTVFFIVNNTKSVQEKGPYPPNYNSYKDSIPRQYVDPRVSVVNENKDSIN